MIPTTFNHREILAAAPDAVALAAGVRLDRPHPLAEDLSLGRIAYACGFSERKPLAYETDKAVMGRGMGTAAFSKILADGVTGLAIAMYKAQAEHGAFSVPMDVRGFRPASIPALDADLSLEPLGENAEIMQGSAFSTAGAQRTVNLITFARAVRISREAVINDELGAFALIIGNIGASAARVEARLVADALEANPVLDDGDVVFHASHNNVAESPLGMDARAISEAMTLLRGQITASGQRADLRARHLVTAPGLEYTARKLMADAAMDVVVSTMANLPAGRWYLLADPAACPVVATLRLAGSSKPVMVEQRNRPPNTDDTGILVRADLGACLMRRTGIVRGGA